MVMVNANKISLVKGNNYGLRKLCSLKFSFLDLYGRGWEISFSRKIKELTIALVRNIFSLTPINFKSIIIWLLPNPAALGSVAEKSEVMSKYKYALVIENQNTYVSEKLFDAFFSGCIPIYVGPKIENSIIRDSLFVAADPNPQSIRKAFNQAQRIDYGIWLEDLKIWLSDERTMRYWNEVEVQKMLAEKIREYLEKTIP
jgi:hypothetical protein